MTRRFWIICSVIGLGLLTLSGLGLSSLKMHRKGLQAERQQEFMDVAKQISFEVKKKVDAFLLQEKNRPYTDYQQYYVPQASNEAVALVQSPLVHLFSNGLARGYFQLDSEGTLMSPYAAITQGAQSPEYTVYFDNVRQNLLPSLQNGQTLATRRIEPPQRLREEEYGFDKVALGIGRSARERWDEIEDRVSLADEPVIMDQKTQTVESKSETFAKSKGAVSKRGVYPISSLDETQQQTQVLTQNRANYELNVISNTAVPPQESAVQTAEDSSSLRARRTQTAQPAPMTAQAPLPLRQQEASGVSQQVESEQIDSDTVQSLEMQSAETDMRRRVQVIRGQLDNADSNLVAVDRIEPAEQAAVPAAYMYRQQTQADTVQVRIEPFVPITVPDSNSGNTLFAGQVFLLRHVQIEDTHLVQGFQLNEDELLSQITESARPLLRRGMGYEISKQELPGAAFAAILQFDFGEIVLNLLEQEPGYIQAQVLRIRNWFFGILAVVWVSVLLAMAALWKNMHQQIQLSRKKDDFISAVSHELRTPLTSIRMYTEMLEKDWIKTDDKRREYYTTMRTESERLSRLIENVLDFSRIQRGKKKYNFTVGDVNECIGEVVQMMRPYAARAGFILQQQFEIQNPFAFDRDAVVQIVINLLDNALKYAKDAQDRHIMIRTRKQKDYAVIEVEDHGPGIPRRQQKKIFDAFYRCEDESTRQSTGTGLGLALVKRFAEAHKGFVEIANAKPTGALFRVGLTCTS